MGPLVSVMDHVTATRNRVIDIYSLDHATVIYSLNYVTAIHSLDHVTSTIHSNSVIDLKIR